MLIWYANFAKILFQEIQADLNDVKKIRVSPSSSIASSLIRAIERKGRKRGCSPRTPGIQISCACRKGGQVANRAAREGNRDRHPETFITFGFKGAHCAVNGVPRVPSFLLSRSYVLWIRFILRRLPFREYARRRGRKGRM